MRKLGIPPENLQPNRYAGPRANLVPCVEAKRRPLVTDTQYPLLSLWRVDFSPSTGTEGEVWQLVKFETSPAGDATWRRIDYSGAGPGMDTITVDNVTAPGINPVSPDGVGNMGILGTVVANHAVPLESHSRALNTFSLELQVSTDRTGAPANSLDAGVCSFDDTAFVVDANGYVTLTGGAGPAVDSVTVDVVSGTGVNPVVPSATGVISVLGNAVVNGTNANAPVASHSRAVNQFHIDVQISTALTGAPADPFDAGICSFDDTAFAVDGNGYVTLAGGAGPAADQFTVDAATGPGVNPVVPSATGDVTIAGTTVIAHSVPIETHTRAVNVYNIEVQQSATANVATVASNGLAHFDDKDFVVATGFVTAKTTSYAVIPGSSNLGINYAVGTGVFKITSADGTALSASNVGRVTLPSKTSPGYVITIDVVADQSFIDDNGASEIIGNLFGVTTSVAWAQDIPFFIYGVVNDDEDTIQFMLSRSPSATVSPAAANIGAPDDAVADALGDFWSLDNITETVWNGNPCVCLGSFRMQMSASDDWTVQTLGNADGFGLYHEDTHFTMPEGQMGAAASTYVLSNAGTEPQWATNEYLYQIHKNGMVYILFNSLTIDVAGVGTETVAIVLPYAPIKTTVANHFTFTDSSATTHRLGTYSIASGASATSSSVGSGFILDSATANLTNADFDTSDSLQFRTYFQAF